MSNKFANKNKLKKQDFLFRAGWFEEIIKIPGSMYEQQFQMQDCEDCSLFILDPPACVYIDASKYCYIFIAPCQSSVFIRNCYKCTVICCTRQFRSRDCIDCNISLWCESQPVIENSTGMKFDCFPNWGYDILLQQFAKFKLDVWNNNWWDIYDFTKKQDSKHFQLTTLDEQQVLRKSYLLDILKKCNLKFIENIVPYTHGTTIQTQTIVYALQIKQNSIVQTFRKTKARLIKAKVLVFNQQYKQLELMKGKFVFIEFPVEDCKVVEQILKRSKAKISHAYSGDKLKQIYTLIFVPFKDAH